MTGVDPLDVLAILEERPYLEADLVALFGASADVVRFVLKGLSAAGHVTRVGADRRWALASCQAPAPPPARTKPARVLPHTKDVDEDLDDAIAPNTEAIDGLDDDLVDDDEALPAPVQRQRGQRRLYPATTDAGGAPLRQAKAARVVASGIAWWVGLTREQFAAEIAQRAEAMRGTKENLRVPLRILQ